MSEPAEPTPLEARIRAAIEAAAFADAASLIVRHYGPGALGYLASLLRDDEAAREAFSELGEELWKALPRFAGKSSAKTWTYAIAYRCALRHLRRRARRRTRPLRDSEYSRIAASVASTSHSFARTEAARKLDALRAALSHEEHTLLVLRVDRRMAWEEIAAVLGKTAPGAPAALRKRYQRLKGRLRTAAVREGLIGTGPRSG